MTSKITVGDINEEAKQETNTETVEPIQEEPIDEPAIENVVEPTGKLPTNNPKSNQSQKRKNHPYP